MVSPAPVLTCCEMGSSTPLGRFAPQTSVNHPVSSSSSGPTPLTLSSTESSSISRTLSSVSDVPSISTGVVEDDVVSPPGARAASEISTEPSLLSSRVSTGSVHHLPTPTRVSLPPSPMPPESPAAPISVSLTTPQSNVPSIHSVLETEPTCTRTKTITHDINRIFHHVSELDRLRRQETREIAENVRIIRDELHDLSDYVHTHLVSSRRVASQRSPVSYRNQSVGGSSTVSDGRRMAPAEPCPRPGLIPIPLTPPPQVTRTPSVSSSSSRGSFLSSHHSDDMSLLGAQEGLELSPSSPSRPSEPSPFSSDLGPSIISSSEPSPGPSLSLTSSSPTPSTTSSSTACPVEGVTLVSIRDMLAQLRQQITALLDGQMSINHTLDELLQSRLAQPDNTWILERLQNIERLIERSPPRRRPRPRPCPCPRPHLPRTCAVSSKR